VVNRNGGEFLSVIMALSCSNLYFWQSFCREKPEAQANNSPLSIYKRIVIQSILFAKNVFHHPFGEQILKLCCMVYPLKSDCLSFSLLNALPYQPRAVGFVWKFNIASNHWRLPEVAMDPECQSRLPQDFAFFFRTRSQNFVKNRIRSHFSISPVAWVCEVIS